MTKPCQVSRGDILSTCLFLALSCTSVFSQDAASPVGTWELSIARPGLFSVKETGAAFITFNDDNSLTGYGLTTGAFSMFTLTGNWQVDPKGKLTGAYKEDLFGKLIDASFTGKAVAGKRIEMTSAGLPGRFKLNGVPVQSIPDISGVWKSTITRINATSRTFETYQFTSLAQFPGVFDITGNGTDGNGSFTVFGTAIVTAKGKVTAFKINNFGGGLETSDTLVGNFREKQQIIGFLGNDGVGLGLITERLHLSRP